MKNKKMKNNKVKSVLLFIVTIITINTNAQVNMAWAGNIDNLYAAGDNNYVDNIATDGAGNVIAIGRFKWETDFNPSSSVTNSLVPSPSSTVDVFITKWDANGNYIWHKRIGNTNAEKPTAIKIDANDNIYIAGTFGGTLDIDPSTSVSNINSNNGSGFVIKYNPSGGLLWGYAMHAASANIELALDASANVYCYGSFDITRDLDPTAGVSNFTANGATDAYVTKLTTNGAFVFCKQFGGSLTEPTANVDIDALGNILLNGSFYGTADFDPSASTSNLTATVNSDGFVLKLNSIGDFVWVKQFTGVGYVDPTGIKTDAAGNIYSSGYFDGDCDFDPSASVVSYTATGGVPDIFLTKLDVNGNYVFSNIISSPNYEISENMAIDVSGNTYMTGRFVGTVDFDPSSGVTNLINSGTNFDAFVVKYLANGTLAWANQIASPTKDLGICVSVDAANNVYCGGTSWSSPDCDPTAATYTTGTQDAYICKWTQVSCPTVLASLAGKTNVLCNGGATGTATVSASGGASFTYAWLPSGGTTNIASGLSTGTYTCNITNDCGNATTQTVQITQPNALVVNVVSSNSLICSGSSASLTATNSGGTGAITYTWSNGGTGQTISINPITTSNYTVTGVDANNCSKSNTITQNVNVCTGINNQSEIDNIYIYPNPTNGLLTFNLSSTGNEKIQISNSLGQVLISFNAIESATSIDISNLPTGIYFATIILNNQTITKKIIKQ